jgi:NitT/TauT family transport system substrate-binding protein
VAGLASRALPARAAETPVVRLGTVQFGTAQWAADVIQRNHLDVAHGFALQTVMLANTDAARVALLSGGADIVVSDWFFVASQRAEGTKLTFAPFSSALGGVLVRADSPIRSLADLSQRKLGVAGGPQDKSWLVVQAAGNAKNGIDLARVADVVYGAPPLLNAKLMQGELDAVLTFWTYAARLEAAGYRQVISVAECAKSLGLPDKLCLVGFVFHEDWANKNEAAIVGFLTAAAEAQAMLAGSVAEWQQVRPLMDAPDDALFNSLRQRFFEGIAFPPADVQEETATKLIDVLQRTGGARALGGLSKLPAGVFWQGPYG